MKKEYSLLGLMSGTSLDGLDIAFCRFSKTGKKWEFNVGQAATSVYPDLIREKLTNARHLSGMELSHLDIRLGEFMASEINDFIRKYNIKPDYIASHGHTIFHQPQRNLTLQIGNGAVIAAKTGMDTIVDFRSLDIALGGQGAPLVPMGDQLLFSEYDICLNLGGISNISFRKNEKRLAFDISPCNIPLNRLSGKMGYEMDRDGLLAQSGEIDEPILSALNKLEYYQRTGPKSLGMEWINEYFLPVLDNTRLPVETLLCTVTEHIALQIADTLNQIPGNTVLATGGGAKNKYLIERITGHCNKKIIVPDEIIIEYKEAIVFAFLGLLRVLGLPNTLSSVTGASRDSCGGTLFKIT